MAPIRVREEELIFGLKGKFMKVTGFRIKELVRVDLSMLRALSTRESLRMTFGMDAEHTNNKMVTFMTAIGSMEIQRVMDSVNMLTVLNIKAIGSKARCRDMVCANGLILGNTREVGKMEPDMELVILQIQMAQYSNSSGITEYKFDSLILTIN